MAKIKGIVAIKGGSGSGNWGHAGRPGLVGGSGGGAGIAPIQRAADFNVSSHATDLGMKKVKDVTGVGGSRNLEFKASGNVREAASQLRQHAKEVLRGKVSQLGYSPADEAYNFSYTSKMIVGGGRGALLTPERVGDVVNVTVR